MAYHEGHTLHRSRLLAFVMAVIILSALLVPTVAQASETALDSYDSTTDIGGQLMPKGEFTAETVAWRNELFFKAVKYHQNAYNLTVDAFYLENEKSSEDSLRFIVAKAKDTYQNNAEVMIEVVVTGPFVHIFARQSGGRQETIRDFFQSHGKVGEKSAFAVRYSNRRLWFYENGQKVFANVDLGQIQPLYGCAAVCGAGFSVGCRHLFQPASVGQGDRILRRFSRDAGGQRGLCSLCRNKS